jgi:murein DD-endopeptidase MepM/ murein hydrolase activator NlpD
VAWASFPRPPELAADGQAQWQALAIAPLSSGAATGMRMAPSAAVQPVEFVQHRAVVATERATPLASPASAPPTSPLRIRGRVGDGLYWSLRAAGASPQVAAQYLAALATEIDVGEVAPTSTFDLVLGPGADLLYAGLGRLGERQLQLVKWTANGRSEWIDAASAGQPQQVSTGMAWPVNGHVTSYFGYRYHPILHFTRFHAGIDIGAAWGSPIMAAADGQVVTAGWTGGYGRAVQIAHGGGISTMYGHMSQVVAVPGSYVHAGQLIGYVGSSGLSTGPHLHYEVRRNGTPVNPLAVRFSTVQVADTGLINAVKARLQSLLSLGGKRA